MSSRGPAVVIGAGNVGCGIVADQLLRQGREVVLVTHTPEQAVLLASGGVQVRHTGGDGRGPDRVLTPAEAVPVGDLGRVLTHLRAASVVVVAVTPGHADELAGLLALGLMTRTSPVNVVVVDNRQGGATRLGDLVTEQSGDRVRRHGFVAALVDRIANSTEAADGSRRVLTEPHGHMYLDARALRTPVDLGPQVQLVEDLAAYTLRKLFVFSAGHAATAYLGQLRGHRLVSDALADPEVRMVTRLAMLEGQAGIAACFGERFAGGPAQVDRMLARFVEPALADTVERVGRNVATKLTASERILGPAQLALAAGAAAPALALVTAAALRSAESDPHVGPTLHSRGRAATLSRLSGLPAHHRLVERAVAAGRGLDAGLPLTDLFAILARPAARSTP